jgi:hypothetical protein
MYGTARPERGNRSPRPAQSFPPIIARRHSLRRAHPAPRPALAAPACIPEMFSARVHASRSRLMDRLRPWVALQPTLCVRPLPRPRDVLRLRRILGHLAACRERNASMATHAKTSTGSRCFADPECGLPECTHAARVSEPVACGAEHRPCLIGGLRVDRPRRRMRGPDHGRLVFGQRGPNRSGGTR